MTNKTRSLLAAGLLVAALAGCSDDEGAGVRSSGEGASSGSGSGSGSGSASASGVAECSPVGEDIAGDAVQTVPVELKEYSFTPGDLEAPAGVVTFKATNAGEEDHELAFLPGGGDVPLTAEGAPDEDALVAAGAFELEAFPAGGVCDATWDLEPGTYTMFCIVEAADGETHASKGMIGRLTVA